MLMKNKKVSSLLKEWYEGNLSFDERMDNDSHKKETAAVEEKEIRLVKDVEKVNKMYDEYVENVKRGTELPYVR